MFKFLKNIFKRKTKPVDKLQLYTDYVLAIDYDTSEGRYLIRFCYIKELHEDGSLTVNIPSLDIITELEWVPSMNNFVIKDKLDIIESLSKLQGTELPSIEGNLTLSSDFTKFEK